MVATDIAARGIDIDQLPHVVTHDLPNVPEDYIHRIGRTGATGEAISLVCVDEHEFLHDIEKLIKRTLPRVAVPGFEPDLRARPQPIQQRQGQQRQGEGKARNAGQGRNGGQARSMPGTRAGGQAGAAAKVNLVGDPAKLLESRRRDGTVAGSRGRRDLRAATIAATAIRMANRRATAPRTEIRMATALSYAAGSAKPAAQSARGGATPALFQPRSKTRH